MICLIASWPIFSASTMIFFRTSEEPHSTITIAVFHAGNRQIQAAVLEVRIRGIDHITSIDQTHADGAHGFVKRILDTNNAVEAPTMASIPGSISGSAERTARSPAFHV
jgi:hypothetical protein